ncbi:hypothetical protein IGS68_06310 [Skermanella sp. TT6]|mgnify:FL=1|uniref:Uncharacterized protein n=1 Tax=Skermanella cutis TaxID=2775420 RepID=A0ABX7B8X5_9PROT|nr:hypothetical protein [Skermanella sp. TT6]QQP90835.1 hypothetical protein IGS68_06310 [Skermanella sp. TT6]
MSSADLIGQIMEKPAEFAPSTFAQRGVAVDFTTPLLVQARIRQSTGDSVELILPNLAGGRGSYILAWRSLVQFATITMHDHALYESVLRVERIDPATVRTATLGVAAEGLAGRDAMRRAQALLAQEKEEALLTNFLLVVDLLKLAGISAQELMTGRPGEDTEARMKRAIFQVSGALNISPEILYQRIESLTRSTFSVGLPWAPAPGRLRRLLLDLDSFQETVSQWQSRDVSGAAEVGRFAVQVAIHTTTMARLTLVETDAILRNVLSIMRNWDRDSRVVSGQMSRLAWLLDGWSYIVSLWTSVVNEPHERQRDAILDLARLIPVMPKEVSEWTESGLEQEARTIQRKWVRLNQDWRTGRNLRDQVVRNELLKGAMR